MDPKKLGPGHAKKQNKPHASKIQATVRKKCNQNVRLDHLKSFLFYLGVVFSFFLAFSSSFCSLIEIWVL